MRFLQDKIVFFAFCLHIVQSCDTILNMKNFFFEKITFEHKLTNRQNVYFQKHLHNEWEIYYFQNGTASYIIGNKMFKLQNNDLLIVPPQVFHRAIVDSNIFYERTIISFPTDKISKNVIKIAQNLPMKFNIENHQLLKSLIRSVESFVDDADKQTVSNLIVKTVELIFFHLSKFCQQTLISATPQNLLNSLFSNILTYIDEHLCEKLSLQNLAKQFYTSSSWISHHFKQSLGTSCLKYINTKRILQAQRLIQQGELPTEVCFKYCYADYSSFYRQYKQVIGNSPEKDKPANQ